MKRIWAALALAVVVLITLATYQAGAASNQPLRCGAEDVVLVNSHTDDPSCVHVDEL